MTDTHARIAAFLQQKTAQALHNAQADIALFHKAGLLPFVANRFLVMKPVAKHAHLPPPAFQLCKGTRMALIKGEWTDLREGQTSETAETLAATALREGMEELALSLEGINDIYDLGPYDFASASSGAPRRLWLFAARLSSEQALQPESDMAETTAARRWLTTAEFAHEGRKDHRPILEAAARQLKDL